MSRRVVSVVITSFPVLKSAALMVTLAATLLVSCAHAPAAVVPPAGQSTASDSLSLTTASSRTVLRWQTETESNTFAYYVYRSEKPDSDLVCINTETPVHAAGTSTTPAKYVYFDLAVEPGKVYYYKLQSKDLDGTTEWIVGADKPVKGTAKPLTEAEVNEIRTKGQAYREETR